MKYMHVVEETPSQKDLAGLSSYSPFVAKLLLSRGIKTEKQAQEFFNPTWSLMDDPFSYEFMYQGVERTEKALQKGETIGIFSDYDCDGIPAAATLYIFLKKIGAKNIEHYSPNRNREGFGVNDVGIQELKEKGATLVFILDCGTAHAKQVEIMRKKGMDVIILDHHLPDGELPDAILINPAVEKSIEEPYPCACGVVFDFIRAMLQKDRHGTQKDWEKWLLDLVSLATIADAVPMLGKNRLLSHFGLIVLRKSSNPGILALCKVARVDQTKLTSQDVSFYLAPMVNSASRMGSVSIAFNLLVAESASQASDCVNLLKELNEKRKTEVKSMVRSAKKQLKIKNEKSPVWVLGDRSWKPSLVGLVASKISEEFGKAVFVWGMTETGDIKGSCRSPQINIFELMQKAGGSFIEFGGHPYAGGFSIAEPKIISLEGELNAVALDCEEEKQEFSVFSEVTIGELHDYFEELKKFAPFGKCNENPLFAIVSFDVLKESFFGKGNVHCKCVLKDETGSISAIRFFGGSIDSDVVYGRIEWDSYRKEPFFRIEKVR